MYDHTLCLARKTPKKMLEKKFMQDLLKEKVELNKNQHHMIRDMAYFEALI
jgi:hypothetical protein